MLELLEVMNNFWNNYPIEFLLVIFGWVISICVLINNQLPIRFQINKRFSFWRKIEKTMCAVRISISCNKSIEFSDLQNTLSKYWNKETRNVEPKDGTINFNSLRTGSNYKIRLVESDDEDKSTITIENFNGFAVGTFGGLKFFESTIDEIQEIVNLFTKEKELTERVVSSISLTPKKKSNKENITAQGSCKNCSYKYNFQKIQITNNGFPGLKSNVKNILYEWMSNFV
jgi:hypothetical protein